MARKQKAPPSTAVATAKPPRMPPQRPTAGPTRAELLNVYRYETGNSPYPRSSKGWLLSEVRAAESARRTAVGFTALGLVANVVAGVGAYRRAKAEGSWELGAIGSGVLHAAPGLALTSVAFAAAGLSGHKVPFTATVAKFANRSILPALALWQAHHGAIEDSASAIRGAGRGLVRAVDPTAIFMEHGFGEQVYNRTFGGVPQQPAPSFWGGSPPPPKNAYVRGLEKVWPKREDKNINWRWRVFGAAYMNDGAAGRDTALAMGPAAGHPRAEAQRPAGYKDTWTDSRGRSYARKDFSVRSAA